MSIQKSIVLRNENVSYGTKNHKSHRIDKSSREDKQQIFTETHRSLKGLADSETKRRKRRSKGIKTITTHDIDLEQSCRWKHVWDKEEDMRLKRMVIEEGVMDWEVLSATFRVEIKEVQMRWRKILFELLRVNMSTHSDNLLWTKLEDRIIVNGEKQAGEWGSEKSLFLPHRTVGSIRTRKRRTMLERIDRVSKVLAVEECLHKISMRYRAEADLKIPEQQ